MIFVDQLLWRGAPWKGGRSSRLISDTSLEELLDFAVAAGFDPRWCQHGAVPKFELSPRQRARAIAHGATPLGREAFLEASSRFRSGDRQRRRASRAAYDRWIAAGPGRGPYPGAAR